MSAHRLVVSNVWKGLKLVPPNLTVHATPTTEYERDDPKRRHANVELYGTPLCVNRLGYTDIDTLSSGLGCNGFGTGSICALYEGPSTRRLDVFPLTLNVKNDAWSHEKATKEIVARVRRVNTAEAGVQTELFKKETKPLADEFSDMINKFRAYIENEVGLEMAAEELGAEAIHSWTEAANFGSGDAMYNLAMCYLNGRFVAKNLTKAICLWKKASKLGHPLSMYQLAVCHIRGVGVAADRNHGIALMEKSAEAGCPRAQYFMASKLLREGERDRSVRYLQGAIRQEDIRNEIKKWLKMHSLPKDVRKIVVASLDLCS